MQHVEKTHKKEVPSAASPDVSIEHGAESSDVEMPDAVEHEAA